MAIASQRQRPPLIAIGSVVAIVNLTDAAVRYSADPWSLMRYCRLKKAVRAGEGAQSESEAT